MFFLRITSLTSMAFSMRLASLLLLPYSLVNVLRLSFDRPYLSSTFGETQIVPSRWVKGKP